MDIIQKDLIKGRYRVNGDGGIRGQHIWSKDIAYLMELYHKRKLKILASEEKAVNENERREDFSSRVFDLANELATGGYENQAVLMHSIANTLKE